MKPSSILPKLKLLIANRKNVLLTGSPGGGKTSIATRACVELGYKYVIWHPVVSDPTDYKGLPAQVLHNGEPSAKWLPFGDLWQLIDATEPLVVIIDDLGQAPPAVQAALMQLLLGGKINGHHISEHVRFVAATNRRQDQAAVGGLITPLLDRFSVVLPLDFDLDDWVQYGIEHNTPTVLLAFARFRPDLFGEFKPNRDMQKSPTPRSITGLGELLNLGLDDLETVTGAVGEAFAAEFMAFYRTWLALPDRTEIYLNPTTAPLPDPSRPDVQYALMGALAHGATAQNFDATVAYLERVPPEFSVLCVKDAQRRTPDLKTHRAFTTWCLKHKHVVFGE